jgi:hypothetical protein
MQTLIMLFLINVQKNIIGNTFEVKRILNMHPITL